MEEGPTYSVALGVDYFTLVALDHRHVPLVALVRRRIAPAFSVGFPAIGMLIDGI